MADLKNPMRFSMRNRTIDIEEKLRHPDADAKRVTKIEFRDGQLYVYWEEVPRDESKDAEKFLRDQKYYE